MHILSEEEKGWPRTPSSFMEVADLKAQLQAVQSTGIDPGGPLR